MPARKSQWGCWAGRQRGLTLAWPWLVLTQTAQRVKPQGGADVLPGQQRGLLETKGPTCLCSPQLRSQGGKGTEQSLRLEYCQPPFFTADIQQLNLRSTSICPSHLNSLSVPSCSQGPHPQHHDVLVGGRSCWNRTGWASTHPATLG